MQAQQDRRVFHDGNTREAIRLGAQPIMKRLIAIFISNLLGGGAQRRTLAIAHTFAARGHKVHLVVVRPDGPLRCELY